MYPDDLRARLRRQGGESAAHRTARHLRPCLGTSPHIASAAMRPRTCRARVREVGTQMWRGVTLLEMLTYWAAMNAATICRAAPRLSMVHPIATQTLHAAGAAMAFKSAGSRAARSPTSATAARRRRLLRGDQSRGARALPVVFAIVNNGWAISVRSPRRPPPRRSRRKRGAGIPASRSTATTCRRARVVSQALETGARRRPCVIEPSPTA